MTSTAIVALAVAGTTTAGWVLSEVVDLGSWSLVALAAMGGFIALIFKRVLDRQDVMHAENRASADRREEREEKRADLFTQQVLAMQAMVSELRLLNDQHKRSDEQRAAAVQNINGRLDDMPTHVADEVEKRDKLGVRLGIVEGIVRELHGQNKQNTA